MQTRSTYVSRTLLENEGASVLVPLAIPVLITALALARSRTRSARTVAMVGAFLLWIFTILGAMSIGYIYLPATGALTLAARRLRPYRLSRFLESFPPAPPTLG